MERKKYILITFIVFLSVLRLNADYKSDIYNAFISNDMGRWKKTIDLMNLEKSKSNDFILELINFQYGYIGWCMGNDRERDAEKYMALAEKNITILESRSYKPSFTNSYRSAFYGFRIGLNVIRAPFYGPKSIRYAEQAIKDDVSNPFGYIQYANCQYYMPEAFGGSKEKAIEYYLKALRLMESKAEWRDGDWNYLNLLTVIGKAYKEAGDSLTARGYYEKALAAEPAFMWIRDELYPEIIKKL